jgi:hypothetical protein
MNAVSEEFSYISSIRSGTNQQAAEKDPYASLRSITSLQRTMGIASLHPSYKIQGWGWEACPERSRRIDFARASPLDLFEQPARGFPASASIGCCKVMVQN